ncbi:LysR substrate-binding domain-containing protein [Agrobacterium sp. CG674]
MRNRKNIPVAALRAFEAASRHGRLVAAAEELSVTHGAISRHVSLLETLIGTQLFEGPRNRPQLTAEGLVLGFALTSAFDQIEDALRIVRRGDDTILDVACLSTFAMRWLIPRLHDFTTKHPRYDVRLATDDRMPRTQVDVQILVLSTDAEMPQNCSPLFQEQLGLIIAPAVANGRETLDHDEAFVLPRLETKTRPHVWQEWAHLTGQKDHGNGTRASIFDHYHLTIEAVLNGLGAAIVPWHLVAGDIDCGRLAAPFGFLKSDLQYVVKVERPGRRKTEHFVSWLKEEIAKFPQSAK